MGAGSSDVAGASGPQGKSSGASSDHWKSPNTPGRRPSLEELRRMLVGDGRAIALHRLDFDYPLKEYGVQRPR